MREVFGFELSVFESVIYYYENRFLGTFRGHSKRPSTVVQKPRLIVRAKHENEILYNATILKTERRFNKYTIFRFSFNY